MYNNAILIGWLTANPELKHTAKGFPVLSFSLAVQRKKSKEKTTDFITIVAWGETSGFICRNLKKGSPIGIDGSIQVRKYEDKDGNKRQAVEVVANSVFFVGSKGKELDKGDDTSPPQAEPEPIMDNADIADPASIEGYAEVASDDDLPF